MIKSILNNSRKQFVKQPTRGVFKTNQECIDAALKYGVSFYVQQPVACVRGERIYLYDVEGNQYYDFLNGISTCSQGHQHPKLVKAMQEQAQILTHCSPVYYNDQFGYMAEYVTKVFGFDKILMMNSGTEACETAVKIARRWGYRVKGIPHDKAKVLVPKGCFWGRSITASGASSDTNRYKEFGPITPGFEVIEYNSIPDLEKALEDPNVCAYMVESIQGEAGVVVPDEGYMSKVCSLTKKHNVLLICDEVQAGIGRTGALFGYSHEECKPDLVTVAKAFTGGMMPVSGVLGNKELMDSTMEPGSHGSTFAYNPLACKIAKTAVEVIMEEGLIENAAKMGDLFSEEVNKIKSPLIKERRGKGLLRAVQIVDDAHVDANDLCSMMLEQKLLARATHKWNVRMAPALVIKPEEIKEGIRRFGEAVKNLEKLNSDRAKGL